MKKMIAVTALLTAFSLAFICAAHASVNSARDQVSYVEYDAVGDVSAAEGLKLHYRTQYERHLFWETDYYPGETPEISTEFDFSAAARFDSYEREPSGVSVSVDFTAGHVNYDDLDVEPVGIVKAYCELIEETPYGTEKKKTIRIGDYCDYYPLCVNIDTPYTDWYFTEYNLYEFMYGQDMSVSEFLEQYPYVAESVETLKYFSEFFKIPVLEDEQVKISVRRDTQGKVTGGGYSSAENGDEFYMFAQMSVMTDDAVFFCFSNRTRDGNIVDTSLIPGGYGIYRLPYYDGSTDGTIGIKADELETAYPIDEQTQIHDLRISPDKTKLLLFAWEEGDYILTVIDAESMETLQRIVCFSNNGEDHWAWVYEGEDFVALFIDEAALAVLTYDGDKYTHEFTVEDSYLRANMHSTYSVMDFDGEKLAVADMQNWYYTDFSLSVYDATGLLYHGEYKSSLNADCYPCGEPVQVSWEKA